MAVPIRSPADIQAMGRAGCLLWSILDEAIALCRSGPTTADIDRLIQRRILDAGAVPLLRGHRAGDSPPFPACSSICINEEVGAGIPGDRLVRPGDIVSIDAALSLDGWCADLARCTLVDPVPAGRAALAAAALSTVQAAIGAMLPGRPWSAVAAAARAEAARLGFRILPGFGGHGIGRELHEPPAAYFDEPASDGRRGSRPQDFPLRPGMVLTVEPILTAPGPSPGLVESGDGWTLLTADRASAAHEERTVAVTRSGPVLITGPGGG